MHRELVERRRWLSEERFLHALNYCMLLPGPETQQLAIYIGGLMHRTWRGIVAGAFFVILSIFVLLVLSYTYAAYGNIPALQVTMKDDHIECYYDRKKHLDVRDSTFKNAGKIGLWTKADAQTHFDDFVVKGK